MAMEFRGGNNQIGSSNKQIVHNHFSISIQMHCAECQQHQHQEGVPISQGNEHHVLDLVQRTLASGAQAAQVKVESTTQPQGEAPVKSQIEPATPAKSKVVKKRMVKVSGPGQQTLEPSFAPASANPAKSKVVKKRNFKVAFLEALRTKSKVVKKRRVKVPGPGQQPLEPSLTPISAGTDSVRILDSDGEVLEPGDVVLIRSWWSSVYFLYVGDGYIVRYQKQSGTVVKEKMDLTKPIHKSEILLYGNLKVSSLAQRVQKALQQVGRECPVQRGSNLDFLCWTHAELDKEQDLSQKCLIDYF